METPTFLAKKSQGHVRLVYPAQYEAYITHFPEGEPLEIIVRKRRERRTDRQNRAMWALLDAWALKAGHNVNDLKDDVMGEVFGWSEERSPLTKRQMPRYLRTSYLCVTDFCVLIEGILRLAAQVDGIVLQAPDEYLQAKQTEVA